MKKPIPRSLHGFADFTYVALLATAPEWAGYKAESKAVILGRLLSAGALAYTVCTRAEWGLFRLLPFKAHLAIDAPAALLTTLAPWLFNFSANRNARNTFLAAGLFGTAVTLLTEPENTKPSN